MSLSDRKRKFLDGKESQKKKTLETHLNPEGRVSILDINVLIDQTVKYEKNYLPRIIKKATLFSKIYFRAKLTARLVLKTLSKSTRTDRDPNGCDILILH